MTTGCVLLPGGDVVVPAELLAALLHELELARAPMGVRIPPRSAPMAAVADLMRQGAIAYRQRARATNATIPVVAQPAFAALSAASARHAGLSEVGEVIGVVRAAEILGVSHQRVRVLCAQGGLAARKRRCQHNGKPARVQWEIDADSCRSYRCQTAGTVWA